MNNFGKNHDKFMPSRWLYKQIEQNQSNSRSEEPQDTALIRCGVTSHQIVHLMV